LNVVRAKAEEATRAVKAAAVMSIFMGLILSWIARLVGAKALDFPVCAFGEPAYPVSRTSHRCIAGSCYVTHCDVFRLVGIVTLA
jgi:hypothetical protein